MQSDYGLLPFCEFGVWLLCANLMSTLLMLVIGMSWFVCEVVINRNFA
jgi:hypothetical protein